MGRKTNKEKVVSLLNRLSKKELKELLTQYYKKSDYEEVENKVQIKCPYCNSIKYIRRGKTPQGLSVFKCKDCGKRYNIYTNTIMSSTPYSWNVWVTILQEMLCNQSIMNVRKHLIENDLVPDIDNLTVSAIENKIRTCFAHIPLPKLTGVIQVDEKHFKESQKGVKNPIDVLNPNTRRKGRHRSKPTLYGTMGPEFSTICCAVDNNGHSIAKVVTMGHMELEMFEDEIAPNFENITFLCSDMNPIYTQYATLHKVPQYVCNSDYHKVMLKCDTKQKKVNAYEVDKLDYIVGAGVMNYDEMVKFRNRNKLTINGVNGYHSELERYINRIAKGVSTNHLQAWVSFFNYRWNWRVDHGSSPHSYEDAEKILIDILKIKHDVKIEDIKTHKDKTRKQVKRYSQKLITRTVAARNKSNNPYIKFTEEDGVWLFDKKGSLNRLPEYKVRILAKEIGIRPFSPNAVSLTDLKKQLLKNEHLEECLYTLASGKFDD